MRQHTRIGIVVAVLVGACLLATTDLLAQMPSSGGFGQRSARDSYGSKLAEEVIIEYDQETGSLIVITDEETNQHIQEVIQRLDRPVPQVLIKVLFLEVTHTKGSDIGVEALFEWDGMAETATSSSTTTSSSATAGSTTITTTTGSSFEGTKGGDFDSIESLFGLASQTDGGFFRIIDQDLEVTMRAIANVANLEVLSRPSILARNNQQATITVGQEVPFVRNSRITQDGQTINTVEYEDIGIILEVTPHITSDRLVEMEVAPEISTLTGETVPISDTIDSPVFAKRSAQTRVVVPDGSTVVIGGLMEDSETESVRKIPILGDIPLLGIPFRRTIKSKTKTELLIFLTPHVVEGPSELRRLSSLEKKNSELANEVFSDKVMDKYIGDMDD